MSNRLRQCDRDSIKKLERTRLHKIFFGEIEQKVSEYAEKEFLKSYPKKLLDLAKDPEVNYYFKCTDRYHIEKLKDFRHSQLRFPNTYIAPFTQYEHSVPMTEKIKKLHDTYALAEKEYTKAMDLISSALNSYTNVKKLLEDIPELGRYKYLFREQTVTKYEVVPVQTLKQVRGILKVEETNK